MKLLFEMDLRDYGSCTHTFTRHSARSIIIRNGRPAMIHSLMYDYYKFPGGGIEAGEAPVEAMIRETREETGLVVIPETVREYGYVHRVQRSGSDPTERFVQNNYYFLCEAEERLTAQELDAYEAQESYVLEYPEPLLAIETNRRVKDSPYHWVMFEREARVLERLLSDGLLGFPSDDETPFAAGPAASPTPGSGHAEV